MTHRDKLSLWLAGLAVLCLFLYAVSGILLPFSVAIISSYFLNPAVGRIQKTGISRTAATTIITVSFFAALIAITALVIPVFYNQFLNLMNEVPGYLKYINKELLPSLSKFIRKLDPAALEKARSSVDQASGYALKFIATFAGNIWDSGFALLNLLSLVFITPIVTFYMLRDWNKAITSINKLLPHEYARTIKAQAVEIDHILALYLRGQVHVCLLLGVFYSIALTIVDLEFGLFIGMASGILLFIPYLGALFGLSVGVLVAFFQFGDIHHPLIVTGIFIVGQVIESSFLTPNLVGNKVGLHPVWIIFGLLAGGAMFGFSGVLFAIPVMAIIGVVVRSFLGKHE